MMAASRRAQFSPLPLYHSPATMNDAVPRRLVLSVATLSGGVLANEILLTRLFAIIHSYHFASMMISLALLARSLPFNVEELLWNPVERLWLLLTYLVLTLPFLCAANAVGLALIVYR